MSTRFGTYEVYRILMPGLTFAILLQLYAWTYLQQWTGSLSAAQEIVIFMFAVLVSGITMYTREAPKRRKAFVENQPSVYLQSVARTLKATEALSDDEARRLYFYLLNTHIPPLAHDKIFFFGTIYHIIAHIRRTTFWFGTLCVVSIIVHVARGGDVADFPGLVVLTLSVWAVYLLNIRYNKADRNMQENYQDQILWMEMNRPLIEKLLKDRRLFQRRGSE